MSRSRALVSLVTLAAVACGEDATAPAWITRTSPEAPGAQCSSGGVAIASGPDENADGVLSNDEVDSTQYRCDGAVLTRLDAEAAGANCRDGGTATHVGRDGDLDGVLSNDEVEHTTYACVVDEIWDGDLTITPSTVVDDLRDVR